VLEKEYVELLTNCYRPCHSTISYCMRQ